jgi:cyclopropane fatty-acyl-phospholipid synthase-like methyltransferase
LQKKLRGSKLGLILLRNLNEVMAENPSYHKELEALLERKSYQEAFWESDMGYLWYQGNLRAANVYFNLALQEIEKNKFQSVLDVGCGWGEFPAKAASLSNVKRAVGIDISADIISKAKELHKSSPAVFMHVNVQQLNEHFDLATLFGSTDYIPPQELPGVLEKIIQLTTKKIIIVNSLRKIPFDTALELREAKEIKRYDTGYVQPLRHLLEELKSKFPFTFFIEKAGLDSVLVVITK